MTAPAPKATKTHNPRPIMPDLNEFVSTDAAAERLNLHVVTIRNMIRMGKLEGVKIGGKTWLVSKKSIASYEAETENMSKNDPRRGRKS